MLKRIFGSKLTLGLTVLSVIAIMLMLFSPYPEDVGMLGGDITGSEKIVFDDDTVTGIADPNNDVSGGVKWDEVMIVGTPTQPEPIDFGPPYGRALTLGPVTIFPDGSVTIKPGVRLDEASREFWRAVVAVYPEMCGGLNVR